MSRSADESAFRETAGVPKLSSNTISYFDYKVLFVLARGTQKF